MSALEVIKTDDLKEAKEIDLTNGDKVIIHQERAYDDCYPDGKSFDDVSEGNKLCFSYDVKFHRDGLKKMEKQGNIIRSNPMMVHHNHVSWVYNMGIVITDEAKKNCDLVLTSIGPSFRPKDSVVKGAYSNNCPSRQSAPKASVSCSLLLSSEKKEYNVEMIANGDGFKSKKSVNLQQLFDAMGDETTANVTLSLIIERTYFDLKNLMETNLEVTTVVPASEKILATVLKGEKPTGWDWVITVGEGSPREYFVHQKVLAHSSPLLEVAMRTHNSLGQDQVLTVSHENRFILPKCHADDMPTILSYFYLRTFVLPKFDAFARVGRILCSLLPPYGIANFFIHWESAIVKDAIAFDKKDYDKTLPACARHLISVYCSPYGAMPAAKKVLISTMADSWHMALSRGEEVDKKMGKEEVFKTLVLQNAINSVERYRVVAAATKKSAF